jgi:DNA repair photolyase
LRDFRNPVCIVPKNHLVTRDIDLLQDLASVQAAAVFVSVTTLDGTLTPKLEPRTSLPQHRLSAIRELRQAGVPVGFLVAPVIPGLNDHEIPKIVEACVQAGGQYGGYVPLRLPYANAPLFEDWLARHFPDRKEKVLNRIRAMRGGKLNDSRFGVRMRGEGIFADQIETLFEVAARRAGIAGRSPDLSVASFRVPASEARGIQALLPL